MTKKEKDKIYDFLIIGAGIYGLYAATKLSESNYKVLIIDKEDTALKVGSYVNQARVHKGYHYPRSYSTAAKTAEYFDRFVKDFDFAVNRKFQKIYAIARDYSYTDAESFQKFCKNVGIKCKEIDKSLYFRKDQVEAAFEAEEYSFDAVKIRDYFLKNLSQYQNTEILYNRFIKKSSIVEKKYKLIFNDGKTIYAKNILNATYASINEILKVFEFDPFPIKYEYCEVILCDVSKNIKDVGITVMDGPFFSLMPFGLTKSHSLTSVSFTPHKTSRENIAEFKFGKNAKQNTPDSAWKFMSQLAKKYLAKDIKFKYQKSLFTIKPILKSSEIDDSRPTVIKCFRENPTFITVLSGKISTIYDLDEFLI